MVEESLVRALVVYTGTKNREIENMEFGEQDFLLNFPELVFNQLMKIQVDKVTTNNLKSIIDIVFSN